MRKCLVKHCRSYEIAVQYYNKPVCAKHWKDHCDGNINLKEEFEIRRDSELTKEEKDAKKS